MEWTDIRLTVSKADAEAAEAVATMIAEGGIYRSLSSGFRSFGEKGR